MMRRFVAIFITLLVVFPIIGISSLYFLQLRTLKRQVSQRFLASSEAHEQIVLRFHISETKKVLKWEHSREFEYNGQMYDVISVESEGDTVMYRCWWDHAETSLKKNFKKTVAQLWNKKEHQNLRLSWLTQLWFHYIVPSVTGYSSLLFSFNSKVITHCEISIYDYFLHKLLNPPE